MSFAAMRLSIAHMNFYGLIPVDLFLKVFPALFIVDSFSVLFAETCSPNGRLPLAREERCIILPGES